MSRAGTRNRRWKIGVAGVVAIATVLGATGWRVADAGAARTGASTDQGDALVVIVDGSGSMRRRDVAPNRMDAAKRAASAVLRALPNTVRVGLMAYGMNTSSDDSAKAAGCKDITTLSAVRTMSDELRASLIAKVDAIRPSGYTPIGMALQRGVLSLPDRRGQVIIVTDGEDTCAPPDPCAMARALKQRFPDVTVSTVGLTIGLSDQLACIAEATGGLFVTADDTTQLERRLAAVTDTPNDVTLLTPSGYGRAQLGDTYDELAGKLEGFPGLDQGQPVGGLWSLRNLIRVNFNNADYYFASDQRLVGIKPLQPLTVDGIALNSTAAQVAGVYGKPRQVQAPSALYEASAQTEAGYVITYNGNPSRAQSQVQSIILCLCVPRPPKPTTTAAPTTTVPDAPPTSTTLPVPIVVLTATGYGDAVLGDTYAQVAAKLPGFPRSKTATAHPGLWDLTDLRQITFQNVAYLFNRKGVLVAIQPDQPLTVDGIDNQSSAADVANIYGRPMEIRGQQALYEAAVDSAAAYVVAYDGGAARATSKVTGIAVCLCKPPAPPSTTVAPVETTEAPPPETTEVPPPETTQAPPPETTEAPPPETTEAPPPETTEAPSETTLAGPASTVPRPTIVDPPAVPVTLRKTGIGDVALGTDAADAVTALTALLGAPSEDSGGAPDPQKDCGGPRIVRWQFGDVSLEVTIKAAEGKPDGVFTSYTVGAPNDPTFPVHTLAFDNGLRVGMTWGEWKAALPGSTLEVDADTGLPLGAGPDNLFASFQPVDGDGPPTDATLVRSINVGARACIGA